MSNVIELNQRSNNPFYTARMVEVEGVDLFYIDELSLSGTNFRGVCKLLNLHPEYLNIIMNWLETNDSKVYRDFYESSTLQRFSGLDLTVKAIINNGLQVIRFFSSQQLLFLCKVVLKFGHLLPITERVNEKLQVTVDQLIDKLSLAGMDLGIMLHVVPEKVAALVAPLVQQVNEPKTFLTPVELAEMALKQAKTEAATASLPGLASIIEDHIETHDPKALPGYFTVWEELIKVWPLDDVIRFRKLIGTRMGQMARVLSSRTKPKVKHIMLLDSDGLEKWIRVNKYPITLLPELRCIIKQVEKEFKI